MRQPLTLPRGWVTATGRPPDGRSIQHMSVGAVHGALSRADLEHLPNGAYQIADQHWIDYGLQKRQMLQCCFCSHEHGNSRPEAVEAPFAEEVSWSCCCFYFWLLPAERGGGFLELLLLLFWLLPPDRGGGGCLGTDPGTPQGAVREH